MDIVLTGTGPAAGFPVAGCPCSTCARAGSARWPTRRPAELWLRLDDSDWKVDAGCGLVAPDGSPVRLSPGAELRRGELIVLALGPAGDTGIGPTGLLIRAGGRPPLLWAPQAGLTAGRSPDLAPALAGVELGVAVLGPAAEADPADPADVGGSLVDCALVLARLRAAGSVTGRTRCLLVGAGHRQGSPDRLDRQLRHWGARVPVDGTTLDDGPVLGDGSAAGAPLGGRTLILGGSGSGKSDLAEQFLAARPEVLYLATGPVVDLRSGADPEWARRVERHQHRRPSWWRTVETDEVAALLATAEEPVLLDSVGTWLAGALDRAGAWTQQDGWPAELARRSDELVRAWRARPAPLIAVSDEVGLGVVPATAAGRLFRTELGRLNQRLADESEEVLLVVAGRLLTTDPG